MWCCNIGNRSKVLKGTHDVRTAELHKTNADLNWKGTWNLGGWVFFLQSEEINLCYLVYLSIQQLPKKCGWWSTLSPSSSHDSKSSGSWPWWEALQVQPPGYQLVISHFWWGSGMSNEGSMRWHRACSSPEDPDACGRVLSDLGTHSIRGLSRGCNLQGQDAKGCCPTWF